MIIRGAGPRDMSAIQQLYHEYDFTLNASHIECIFIVEDDNGNIVAVGNLVKILEASFLTDRSQSKKKRIQALKMLTAQADKDAKNFGYDCYHSFASNDSILGIMTKHFSFIKAVGTVLLRWV